MTIFKDIKKGMHTEKYAYLKKDNPFIFYLISSIFLVRILLLYSML
jgi:hypothetical protein